MSKTYQVRMTEEELGNLYRLAEDLKDEGRDTLLFQILDRKIDAIIARQEYIKGLTEKKNTH